MKIDEKNLIPYLIVIVPLSLIIGASYIISTFYIQKVKMYFNSAKERSLHENIAAKKAKSELYLKQINLLFDYKYNRLEKNIKKELNTRVDIAYETARFIYEKYKDKKSNKNIQERIVDALSHMKYGDNENYIFITDYSGNSILLGNQNIDKDNLVSYIDAEYRSIVLEEIQKVRKSKEGLLESLHFQSREKEMILVKDLDAFEWFIGTRIKVSEYEEALKSKLINMIESMPIDKSDFILLYDKSNNLLESLKLKSNLNSKELQIIKNGLSDKSSWSKNALDDYYYYSAYYKPLSWHFVYGFKTSVLSAKELQKQKDLENFLEEELLFIKKASALIILLVVLLSLMLSLKINKIFKNYQREVEKNRDKLEELNKHLEERVEEEITKHREKEKMLIQRSKMAEMGDMLSMIAHQWRQPLNQLSYVLMNIESAYEYDALTQEYLVEKVKEGNEQLAFMSVTIDDFKNYFKPDKQKEKLLISDIVHTSVALIKKTLEVNAIETEIIIEGKEIKEIYKNEFVQVVLNLIKNANDVLNLNNIENPQITITVNCNKKNFVLSVADNGGGIDEEIIDKIFDPYFSTKDEKNGTGLGLYMSKMIIEEHHNGTLTVENLEHGACFRIEI